ncbi:MAG: hypothetical protein CMJ58_18235 [Planctomycetaceae bacterium]|nr:hypothetical protein [Planctomycetaceae bacterium]
MANRIFVGAVVLLWVGSMSWLIIDKVVPSYFGGPPPAAGGFEVGKPVGWRVEWAGREVGRACSVRLPGAAGTSDIHNRVLLDEVPLLDLAPGWMRTVVGDIGDLKFDAATRLEFDSLNNFASFESRVKINEIPDVLRMTGRMNGSYLQLKIRSGELSYPASIPIANDSALSEALFPDAKLPYMYVGKAWHEEVYHPFRSPSQPVETIEVEVVGEEILEKGDESIRVFRVDYRGEASPGIPEEARLQAVAWVTPDTGLVVRQDVYVGQSKLRFVRLSEEEAVDLSRELLERVHRAQAPHRRGMGGYWRCDEDLQASRGDKPDRPRRPEAEFEQGGSLRAAPGAEVAADRPH